MNLLKLIVLIMLATPLLAVAPIAGIPSQDAIQSLYEGFESELAQVCYGSRAYLLIRTRELTNVLINDAPEKLVIRKIHHKKPLPAYENAAIVSMVKNEGDVFFENLCWHYFMGFRKFIIIDNGSTDDTGAQIDLFKELTANSASVIKINDSRVLYAQQSRMNALVKLVETIWPKVDWVFPNDGDEFITLDKSLETIMSSVPNDANCFCLPRLTYIPSKGYFTYKKGEKFYKRLHILHKRNPNGVPDDSPCQGKVAIKTHQNLLLTIGNHVISGISKGRPNYVSGPTYGMHIREYLLRSPEHALRKIVTTGEAFEALKKEQPIESLHYAQKRYKRYLEIGDEVGIEEFKKFMTKGGCVIDECMPLDRAVEAVMLLGIINKKKPIKFAHTALLQSVGGFETHLMDLLRYSDTTMRHVVIHDKREVHKGLREKVRHMEDEKRLVFRSGDFEQIIREEQPDVIHVSDGIFISEAYGAFLQHGIPVISVWHCPPTLQREFNYPLLRMMSASDITQYGVSSYNTTCLKKKLNYPQFETLPYGRNLDYFVPSSANRTAIREKYHIPQDAFVIGAVGRIELNWKRQDWIVDAVEHLHKKGFTNVYGLIVGEGRDLRVLKSKADKSVVRDYVRCVGLQVDPVDHYNAMTVFAHPSKMESFGLVIAEALACNVPVVVCTAYTPNGSEEDGYGMVRDGYNGRVVHADDKQGFFDRLEELVKNEELRKSFAAVARQSVEKFSIQNMVKRYQELFTEAAFRPRVVDQEQLRKFKLLPYANLPW